MAWRLSYDLGTNSIGWCALEVSEGEAVSVLDMGVRIFPDGREPAGEGRIGDPLNMARRDARGMRRQRDRTQKRMREVARVLEEFGLMPPKEKSQAFHAINPYEARSTAATENCDAYTLGRALFHLAGHRGFKSNRKEEKDKEATMRLKQIAELREKLGPQTLGQYLWDKYKEEPKKGKAIRFRGDDDLFPDRAMMAAEFLQIKSVQQNQYHADFWEKIEDSLFFQRPLKAQERGLCTHLWAQGEKRAHSGLPSAERFRIYGEVNNLKWIDGEQNFHDLSEKQRHAIAEKLLTTASDVKFSTLLTLKEGKQPLFPHAIRFNLETEARDKIGAAPVLSKLTKIEAFNTLRFEQQDELVEKLYETTDEKTLYDYLAHLGFDEESREALEKIKLPSKVGNLSAKFMRTAWPLLKESGETYDVIAPKAGEILGIYIHHSDKRDGEVVDRLPYYGAILRASVVGGDTKIDAEKNPEGHYGRIANPTVHVALNQLRKLTNKLVERFGLPEQIVVEVARELKLTREARKNITKAQKQAADTKKRMEKQFEVSGDDIRGQDYLKFRLWEELGDDQFDRSCPFSGRNISAGMLMSGEAQIEHILPYSRTLDDSFANKTLAVREANMFKGQKTPFEAFGHNQATHLSDDIGKSDYSWAAIQMRIQNLPKNKAWRFGEKAMEKYMEGAGDDFLARQATDNAYIARISRQYLAKLVGDHNVWTIKGALTEKIRWQWKLNGLLHDDGFDKKNRSDHRHHAIDAFVVGMTTRSLMQKITREVNAKNQTKDGDFYGTYKDNKGRTLSKLPALNPNLAEQLKEKLDNIIISYKPDHGRNGKFFNETAYGFVKDKGRDFEYKDYNLVVRKPIESLTEKMVKYIRDPHIRGEFEEFKNYPPNSNKAHKDLLIEFSKLTGIKKLRILEKNQSVKPITSAPYKGYAASNYAYVDIWQIPKKKGGKYVKGEYEYKGEFVSFYDAMDDDIFHKKSNRPHPAAKFIMRLFKDDMVELEGEIYKVFGYAGLLNKIDLGPQYLSQKNRKQTKISVNVLINKGLKKLNIDVDGTIKR